MEKMKHDFYMKLAHTDISNGLSRVVSMELSGLMYVMRTDQFE